MKVSQILRRFTFDEWGGTESVVWNTSKKLQELGNNIEIVATAALSELGTKMVNGVLINRFSYFYPRLFIGKEKKKILDKKGGDPYSIALFRHLIASNDIEILHCHTMQRIANCVRLASQKMKIPYVISFHGGQYDVPQKEIDEMIRPLKGTFNYGKFIDIFLNQKRFIDDANGIICVGYNEYLLTKEKYPDKEVLYLPNGVDVEKFESFTTNSSQFKAKYNIPLDHRVILCVSRIDYQKNQLMLVNMLRELRNSGELCHLLIIGPVTSQHYYEQLKKQISLLGLENDVTIIKGLAPDNPDLIEAYLASDLFILPSIHEPFGIVVLEAWAANIPVIAANTGGLKNLIVHGQNGILFDNASLDDLIEKYKTLFSNKSMITEMVSNARHLVQEKYSWKNITEKLISFYARIVAKYNEESNEKS
jgi:glycosyltransferase involved in cell wall biosynthesis